MGHDSLNNETLKCAVAIVALKPGLRLTRTGHPGQHWLCAQQSLLLEKPNNYCAWRNTLITACGAN